MTAIEMRTAELTASPVEPLIPLAESVAPMLVKPIATLVAKPALPRPLLAVATPVFDELQVTALVKSCVELSLYVPIAVNCCAVPSAIEGWSGVTEIEVRIAVLMLRTVEPLIPLSGSITPIVVEPKATLVARPLLPAALLAVATAVIDELHVTELVRSCVELSL